MVWFWGSGGIGMKRGQIEGVSAMVVVRTTVMKMV